MMWIALTLVAVIVAAFLFIGFTQPRPIVRWLDARHGDVFYRFDTPQDAVALTIDDSPTERHTSSILDVLARHGARATFFILGREAERHPALVRRMGEEGHETANHLYSDRPTILLGEETLERHLLATERAILGAVEESETHSRNGSGAGGGRAVSWCRPGFGWYSGRVLRVARRHGYRLALGSVYPHDTKLRSAGLIARIILRRVRPGDIIVLHDRSYTAAVLERILPVLSRRGYNVVTLSELAGE
jgi:peptidoglycan/xylan/chitin deacetylase (PgdA/CDA1 family)